MDSVHRLAQPPGKETLVPVIPSELVFEGFDPAQDLRGKPHVFLSLRITRVFSSYFDGAVETCKNRHLALQLFWDRLPVLMSQLSRGHL